MSGDRELSREMNEVWQSVFGQDTYPASTDRFVANLVPWLASQGTVAISMHGECCDVRGTVGKVAYVSPDESLPWALIGAVRAAQCILEER